MNKNSIRTTLAIFITLLIGFGLIASVHGQSGLIKDVEALQKTVDGLRTGASKESVAVQTVDARRFQSGNGDDYVQFDDNVNIWQFYRDGNPGHGGPGAAKGDAGISVGTLFLGNDDYIRFDERGTFHFVTGQSATNRGGNAALQASSLFVSRLQMGSGNDFIRFDDSPNIWQFVADGGEHDGDGKGKGRAHISVGSVYMGNDDFIAYDDGDNVWSFTADERPAKVQASAFLRTSDGDLKDEVADLKGSIAIVEGLRPRSFRWRDSGEVDHGFIAQEVQKVYEVAAYGNPDSDATTDPMSVDYGKLVPVLTGAIQELLQKVESLQSRVEELETE